MYAKLSMLFVALAATSSVAAWNKPPAAAPVPSSQCDVSNQKCCNQAMDYDDATTSIIGLLGLSTQGLTGQIGVSCSPIASGATADTCTASPLCCTGSNANNLIALNCSPLEAPLIAL